MSGFGDDWFEESYRIAAQGGERPAWADLRPNPHLRDWLASERPAPARALVVGCGYGDDAAELARSGFAVTAFDVAPTAIAAAQARFPGYGIEWTLADIVQMPEAWTGYFELVVEIYTLQVLNHTRRAAARSALARVLAPGGLLFLLCRGRDPGDATGERPPWPLTTDDLAPLDADGLERLSFHDRPDPYEPQPPRRFRGVWRRPLRSAAEAPFPRR